MLRSLKKEKVLAGVDEAYKSEILHAILFIKKINQKF